MSAPIHRTPRNPHTAGQRQLGKRRAASTGSDAPTDLNAEHTMKIQTDVKAGGGFSLLDIDLDLDLEINLFGGCGGCGGHKPRRKC